MKLAHRIELSVFSYPEEDFEQISRAFLELLPFDAEKEKIKIEKTAATGFGQKQIIILKTEIVKVSNTNDFLENILIKLSDDDKKAIVRQSESRIDEELNFFLRLDKDEWIKNGKLRLIDSGRCFHVKISVAAFPKKREIAEEIMRKFVEAYT